MNLAQKATSSVAYLLHGNAPILGLVTGGYRQTMAIGLSVISLLGTALGGPGKGRTDSSSNGSQKAVSASTTKRGRTAVPLSSKTAAPPNFLQFLVMHSELVDNPLSDVSPFVVDKLLGEIIDKFYEPNKFSPGDVLIDVERKDQSSGLLAIATISQYKVSLSAHRTLNTCHEVISDHDPLDTSIQHIIDDLRIEDAADAKRIFLHQDRNKKTYKACDSNF